MNNRVDLNYNKQKIISQSRMNIKSNLRIEDNRLELRIEWITCYN